MKHVILAICCAAALVVTDAVHAQAQWTAARMYGDRPPPPTEPSIALPAPQVVAVPKVEPPKQVVRQIIVRRPRSVSSGPVTMPPPEVLVTMVRSALTSVNQANFTENYSVLRGMTTPTLQARASAAQLSKAFAHLREQNLDLSPALVVPPQFSAQPTLSPEGALKMTGIFPSRPLQINFTIEYLPIDGFWMIDSLSVSASRAIAIATEATSQSTPALAPPPAPVAQSAKPSSPGKAHIARTTLPTGRFIPVEYGIAYRPAFVPTGRRANAKPNARKSSTSAAIAEPGRQRPPAVYLQVTSQRSEAEAKAVFNSLRSKYPAILGDRQAVIRRADLGNKGVYYRAQIGPVSAEQAGQQCNQLKAVGGQCFVQYN